MGLLSIIAHIRRRKSEFEENALKLPSDNGMEFARHKRWAAAMGLGYTSPKEYLLYKFNIVVLTS